MWKNRNSWREHNKKDQKMQRWQRTRKLREVQAKTRTVLPLRKAVGVSWRFGPRATKTRRKTPDTSDRKAGAHVGLDNAVRQRPGFTEMGTEPITKPVGTIVKQTIC